MNGLDCRVSLNESLKIVGMCFGVRVCGLDTNIWADFNQFSLCWMLYRRGRPQIPSEIICLTLEGLDLILGMDLLSINHVVIDCGQRKVLFPKIDRLWDCHVSYLRLQNLRTSL